MRAWPESCARTVTLRDGRVAGDLRPMILLRLISWPYARKHLLRWVLTIGGIVLGVALLVGMYTANQSVLAAFQQHRRSHRGQDAACRSRRAMPGFEKMILERVQSAPRCACGAGDRSRWWMAASKARASC